MSENRPYSYEIDDTDSWDRTFGTLDWGSEERDSGNGCRYPRQPDTETFLRGVLTLLADKKNQNNKYFACDCNALLYRALCDEEFGYSLTEEAKTGLILSLIACGANVKDDHIFSDAARAVHGGLWLNDIKRDYSSTPSRCNMPVIKCMIAAGADVNDYQGSYSYYAEGYGEAYRDACPLIDDIILHRRGDDEAVNLLIECGADMDKEYWYSVYDDENDEKSEFREKQTELRRNYLNGNSPHCKEMEDAKRFLNSLGCEIIGGKIQMALIKLQLFTESGFVFSGWRDMAKSDKEMTQRVYELKNKFKNFDLETKDMFRDTLLSAAIENNRMETARTLISLGADVKNSIVLKSAAWSGNIEMCEELINLGADINKAKALNIAVSCGDIKLAEKLINLGANINEKAGDDDWSSLHEAVDADWAPRRNNVPMVKFLIERGADINIQTKYGKTPLDMITSAKHGEEIKELIRNADKIRADYLARQAQPTAVAEEKISDSATTVLNVEAPIAKARHYSLLPKILESDMNISVNNSKQYE